MGEQIVREVNFDDIDQTSEGILVNLANAAGSDEHLLQTDATLEGILMQDLQVVARDIQDLGLVAHGSGHSNHAPIEAVGCSFATFPFHGALS